MRPADPPRSAFCRVPSMDDRPQSATHCDINNNNNNHSTSVSVLLEVRGVNLLADSLGTLLTDVDRTFRVD